MADISVVRIFLSSVVKLDDVGFNSSIPLSLVSRHFYPIATEFQEFPKIKIV